MRRKVQDVLDWCDRQITKPSQGWDHLCMSMARQAWGQPAWAPSARLAWGRVPSKHRHYTTPDKVPAGAICFGLLSTTYGHAWIAGRDGVGFTVDYRRRNNIDRAPMNLPAWTRDNEVWWTDWSPFGLLPLWDDPRNAAKFPPPRCRR